VKDIVRRKALQSAPRSGRILAKVVYYEFLAKVIFAAEGEQGDL